MINIGPPRVTMELAGLGRPSQELEGDLDYRHGDDELVGYAHAFSSGHPGQEVSLLTHDSGLMMTARALGLPVIPIDDDWLVPPGNPPHERELARLQQEVATLKRQEPRFESDFIDAGGSSLECVELTLTAYQPLTSGELTSAMNRLQEGFPMVTDFEPPTVDALSQIVTKINVNPAGFQQRVERYQSTQYPEWLSKCKRILGNLHRALQQREGPVIAFRARNQGTRPGRDVLVEMQASGELQIRPPLPEGLPFGEEDGEDVSLSLPEPPEPPRRQYVTDALRDFGASVGDLGRHGLPPTALMRGAPEQRRDPNTFYYKPNRPLEPTDYVGLECEQWRHNTEAEYFEVELSWEPGSSEIKGALECSIHAENLSSPVREVLPVRIAVDEVSASDYVDNLLRELQEGPST